MLRKMTGLRERIREEEEEEEEEQNQNDKEEKRSRQPTERCVDVFFVYCTGR